MRRDAYYELCHGASLYIPPCLFVCLRPCCAVLCGRRVRGDAYYELMDEVLTAVKRRYGNTTLLM